MISHWASSISLIDHILLSASQVERPWQHLQLYVRPVNVQLSKHVVMQHRTYHAFYSIGYNSRIPKEFIFLQEGNIIPFHFIRLQKCHKCSDYLYRKETQDLSYIGIIYYCCHEKCASTGFQSSDAECLFVVATWCNKIFADERPCKMIYGPRMFVDQIDCSRSPTGFLPLKSTKSRWGLHVGEELISACAFPPSLSKTDQPAILEMLGTHWIHKSETQINCKPLFMEPKHKSPLRNNDSICAIRKFWFGNSPLSACIQF